MRIVVRVVVVLVALLVATGCSSGSPTPSSVEPVDTTSRSPTPTPSSVEPVETTTPSPTPTPTPTATPTRLGREQRPPDPRWRFYSADRRLHPSPWFPGRHRVMIGWGCTPAPWYDHDPRCPGRQGFHHGIDVALPCGTPITAGVGGTVLPSSAPGTPGPAYGVHPFRIRSGPYDVLVAHARTVYVAPGDRVRPGQRIARASDSGAPDGCHLHLEVRRAGGGTSAAVDPAAVLRLGG